MWRYKRDNSTSDGTAGSTHRINQKIIFLRRSGWRTSLGFGLRTEDWTDFWTGRFRKVSIDVVVHTNPDAGDATTKFVRLAEMLATRLVGLGGTVIWEDSYTAYPDIGSEWIRCVTVERKA
ncbi:hypothetical protein HBI70_072450 [Parastagonospora nodorum]|nr:hypothetical protein HBI09_067750 [Parastagonospora nodorum]KAH4176365.1 hypothetical protein HBH43_057340 [Parastagonospora nodorum]KAH5281273.1 hypothetical protein HBI70_072450 [Parastagonospora nodorum]KAH5364036.1 hypothetical protein HBI49_117040 [Parastagonospora nodorum]KAH5426998.1 hypothetical protein HBI32_078050 [Parastagonospora nodorum]